jgi:hypothetical protein
VVPFARQHRIYIRSEQAMSASRMPGPSELSQLARVLWMRLEPGTDDPALMVQVSQTLVMLAQELDFAVARQVRCAGLNAEQWRALWVQTAKQDEEKRREIYRLESRIQVLEGRGGVAAGEPNPQAEDKP